MVCWRLLEVILMVEITFDLDTSPIGKLPGKWEKARKQGLQYNAEDMTRFLIDETSGKSINVQHGLLHSWTITSVTDEQATINSPAVYAAAQNYGSSHMIYPKEKKALHWGGKPGYFSKGHMVNIKPKRFVEKSFERLQPLILGNFMKALEEQE